MIQLSRSRTLYQTIVNSIAPAIYGHTGIYLSLNCKGGDLYLRHQESHSLSSFWGEPEKASRRNEIARGHQRSSIGRSRNC